MGHVGGRPGQSPMMEICGEEDDLERRMIDSHDNSKRHKLLQGRRVRCVEDW